MSTKNSDTKSSTDLKINPSKAGRRQCKDRPKFEFEALVVRSSEGESVRRREARELFVLFMVRYGMSMKLDFGLRKTG